MKKTFKWIGIVLATPIVLFVVLALALYIPAVQNLIVRQAAAYASESMDMKVAIDNVRLSFPLDLQLNGFSAVKDRDTVLAVKALTVDVRMLPLFKKEVQIDAFDLRGTRVNTLNLIDAVQIKGNVAHLYFTSRGVVKLDAETVSLQKVLLDGADLDLTLNDSVPEDTTSKPTTWKIWMKNARITHSNLRLQKDSLLVGVGIGDASLANTTMDLKESLYQIAHMELADSRLNLDVNHAKAGQGLDYAHLSFDSIQLAVDSLVSQGSNLTLALQKAQMNERSGLKAQSLTGKLRMDSTSIHVNEMTLITPYSNVDLDADVDWSSLAQNGEGVMDVHLLSVIGKQDVLTVLGADVAKRITVGYPDVPLVARINLDGNMQRMHLSDSKLELKSALTLAAQGVLERALEPNRAGAFRLKAEMGNLDFLVALLDPSLSKGYRIPMGISAEGLAKFNGSRYAYDGSIKEGAGRLVMNGAFDASTDKYAANLTAENIDLHHFMPKDSIYLFSGHVKAEGRGFDFYSPHTQLTMTAAVDRLQYGHLDLSNVGADFNFSHNLLTGHFNSDNNYLQMSADLNTTIRKDYVGGDLDLDVVKADFRQMRITKNRLATAFHLNVTASSNLKDELQADGSLTNMRIEAPKRVFTPKDLLVQTLLNKDTVFAHAEAGDFLLDVKAEKGVGQLMKQIDVLSKMWAKQWEEKQFSMNAIREALPTAQITLKSGNNNPFCNFMAINGYAFNQLASEVTLSPEKGIQGDFSLYTFRSDSLMVDTIRLHVNQGEENLLFNGQIRNNRRNPQFVFNCLLNGELMSDGATAKLKYYDKKDVLGVDMGVRAQLVEDGYKITFNPTRPLIAYHTFNVKSSDYIYLHNNMQVEGDMTLLTDEGMGLVFAAHPNEGQQQQMRMDLHKINLQEVMNVLPYMPRMEGSLDGIVEVEQAIGKPIEAQARLDFKDLYYESSPMGNMNVALNYTPKENNNHSVEAIVMRNGKFVAKLLGDYDSNNGGIQMDAELIRFPAELINGFIPDHMVGLRGTMEGSFKLTGDSDKPIVNGTLSTDSVYVFSDMYGIDLRVQNHRFTITDSNIPLGNLILYSEKNDQLAVNGTIDFANLDDISLDLSMRARNFQIVDRPRNNVSLLYGKAYVDFTSTIKGSLANLVMRGTVSLLGSTDVTYVLKDSPLTVEDRLSDLVTFVDFSDTIQVAKEVEKKDITGVDMVLNLNIAQGAQVNCDLSANRESYVDLEGGGNLILRYTPEGKMFLTGRYTINNGEMKYALPVIPLKTFTLKTGSYVEFTGDMMNPKLNLTATEQTRASYSEEGTSPRSVLFDVGVEITKTLQDMGLQFTLSAPEDMTVQNQLAGMSVEMRGKLAVTMLATGIYMAEGNASGNLSMSSALNSFLQSEISNIAGSALQSVDLSFGMEDGTASDGSATTDYSFRFAKRFWGNRVSIIVGGKVSTGAGASSEDSFIDDISIEYRLDDSGTRYVKLFHEKNFDSLLDGEVTETGGGVVLRKKMTKFGELFIFRSNKRREAIMQEREKRRLLNTPAKTEEELAAEKQLQQENQQKENESLKAAEVEKNQDDEKEVLKETKNKDAVERKRKKNK